jgi:hypothetical protein
MLTGEGQLVTKAGQGINEGAVEGDMNSHLGYAKHDPLAP